MSDSGDTIGIILAVIILIVSGSWGQRRFGHRGAWMAMIAVGSHLFLAILSVTETAFPMVDDNRAFFLKAQALALGANGYDWTLPSSNIWPNAISVLFNSLGASVLLGYTVNTLIFFLSVTQLWKFLGEIGSPFKGRTILLFALTPASLLFANFLLRESFQILMLIITVRQLERYRRDGGLLPLILAGLALFPFGAIHNGFFMFAPIALLTAVFGRILVGPLANAGRQMSRGAAVILAVLMLGLTFAGAVAFNDNTRVDQIMSGDIDVGEGLKQAVERGARTALPWQPGQGIVSTIVFLPALVIQFLFAPIIPFMVRSASDLVPGIEALVRIFLMYGVWRLHRAAHPETKRMIKFLMALYIMFCIIAAIGTTTVGTAMRHQLKMFWLLASLGIPGLFITRMRQRVRFSSRLTRQRWPGSQAPHPARHQGF